jgi:hypothetical protein
MSEEVRLRIQWPSETGLIFLMRGVDVPVIARGDLGWDDGDVCGMF